MFFNTVEEALAACEAVGYQPRSHVTGPGEQTYCVHPPGFDGGFCGFCYRGDAQFLAWANAHWRLLEIEEIRHQAGWWEEWDEAGEHYGWHAPCGMREEDWRALGRPMPEEAANVEA